MGNKAMKGKSQKEPERMPTEFVRRWRQQGRTLEMHQWTMGHVWREVLLFLHRGMALHGTGMLRPLLGREDENSQLSLGVGISCLRAFVMEMHLKTISTRDKCRRLGGKKGHNLEALFQNLPEKRRKELEKEYQAWINVLRTACDEDGRKKLDEGPKTLRELLWRHADDFIVFRYAEAKMYEPLDTLNVTDRGQMTAAMFAIETVAFEPAAQALSGTKGIPIKLTSARTGTERNALRLEARGLIENFLRPGAIDIEKVQESARRESYMQARQAANTRMNREKERKKKARK